MLFFVFFFLSWCVKLYYHTAPIVNGWDGGGGREQTKHQNQQNPLVAYNKIVQ